MRTVHFIGFGLLLLCAFRLSAQDTLITRSGEVIPAKVLEINQDEIKYKKFSNLEGPLFITKKSNVSQIRFENGMKQIFSANEVPAPEEKSSSFQNYYAPFHETMKDPNATVNKIGGYFSMGLGSGSSSNDGGIGTSLSISMAYKSHLFSLSRGSIFILAAGGGDHAPYFNSNYYGFLMGESFRSKHSLLSASAGIGSSTINEYHRNGSLNGTSYYYQGISFPVEIKLFLLARNGGGAGFQISENIVPGSPYSQFTFTFSVVFGAWNKK